jgi:hypothetical protein
MEICKLIFIRLLLQFETTPISPILLVFLGLKQIVKKLKSTPTL